MCCPGIEPGASRKSVLSYPTPNNLDVGSSNIIAFLSSAVHAQIEMFPILRGPQSPRKKNWAVWTDLDWRQTSNAIRRIASNLNKFILTMNSSKVSFIS
jgi:hypothetical protein